MGHVDYFRVLVVLVPALRPREALAARQCLQETLKSKGVQPPSTKSKLWDALAAYERRLDGIATNDNKIQAAAKHVVNEVDLPATQDSEEARPKPRPAKGPALSSQQSSVFDDELDDIELPDIPIDDDMLPIMDDE